MEKDGNTPSFRKQSGFESAFDASLAQARDALSIFPLPALLQDLEAFEALQNVTLGAERACSS